MRAVSSLLLLLLTLTASADERILSFHSDITIAEDGSMMVAETIVIRAEGNRVRRGIFREFPTDYRDRYGNRVLVEFEVLEVTRDETPEPWHVTRQVNGVRVYVGSENVYLDPADYQYRITYRTTRQIGFFDTHDELYWNVTGNGWTFPMDDVAATVALPAPMPPASLSLSGYTGYYGASGQDYSASVHDGGGRIRATRPLREREGLTLLMSWPKGLVEEPTALDRLIYLLHDNRGLLIGLLAFITSGIWLFVMWSRFGRDPEAGVVFPHYEPPEGYSPASARYVSSMRYDNTTFSAAIINLAVKGYLTINNDDDEYVLTRKDSTEPLAPGERTLLARLFRGSATLRLENENHAVVSAARTAHRRALRRDYLNTYFRKNTPLLLPSLIASALLFIVIAMMKALTPVVFVLGALNVGLHGLFAYLLKAPTKKGRRLMDKLAGFRLYLDVAEKDDLNLANPPEMTPELFERYLPFAVALGVEHAWAEQFTSVFARLNAETGTPYRPDWYHGDFDAHRLGSFASNVGDSFSSAISSAATPPGSSSGGGGGGFSGGGGGGGGGGSW